jgi:hypothetical protein
LGTLGHPADLTVCDILTIPGAAVHSAAPFHFSSLQRFISMSRNRNNDRGCVLMSGQAVSGSSTGRRIKKQPEDSMPTFTRLFTCFATAASFALVAVQPAQAQSADTSFFLTSTGIGNGGNLGGLAGADNYCQTLAQAAGAGAKTWRAYLSTQAADGQPAMNARDRIGKGPWKNSKGAVIAKDVAELHAANGLTKQTALSEKGDVINGRGDTPNRHDVLTGSQPDGTAFAAGDDRTCKNWTSSTQGSAMVGHSDRIGLRDDDASKSWNSSHPSRGPDGGCSQADLKSTGGDGLLYCFAAN